MIRPKYPIEKRKLYAYAHVRRLARTRAIRKRIAQESPAMQTWMIEKFDAIDSAIDRLEPASTVSIDRFSPRVVRTINDLAKELRTVKQARRC